MSNLKTAGRELLRGNFGNAVKSLTGSFSSTDRGFWMFGVNGKEDQYFEFGSADSSLKAYYGCPPVSAILGQKAQAMVNGNIWVLNTQGKAKDKVSTSEAAVKITKLFNNPNPFQSGENFEAQVYINTKLYGYTVIIPVKPFGFTNNYDTQYLFAIPGNMVKVYESDTNFWQSGAKGIEKIEIIYKNKTTTLTNIDELLIIKDFSPSLCSAILPDSRMKQLEAPINNIIGAMESRGVLIKNRGPRFVISSGYKDAIGTAALTADEKKDMEDQFKQRFGLMREQSQAIFTGAPVTLSTVGFDVKQLGLFEEVEASSSMLCIGLGFPKFLAGLSDPTFNNQASAEKALYQRFIIPEAKSIYKQWNAWFKTEDFNLKIDKDFSQEPVLQEDKMNEAAARKTRNEALEIEWKAGLIKLNEWRVMNGDDPLTDERGDLYYPEYIAQYGFQNNNQQNLNNAENAN